MEDGGGFRVIITKKKQTEQKSFTDFKWIKLNKGGVDGCHQTKYRKFKK